MKPKKRGPQKRACAFRIDPYIYKRFMQLCEEEDQKIGEIVTAIFERYIVEAEENKELLKSIGKK